MAQAMLETGKTDPKCGEVALGWNEGHKGLLSAQREIVEQLKQSSDWWITRWQSKASLISKLAANIGASRSLPETMMAWQQWTDHCVEMVAEDSQHIRDDYQRFIETSARALSNGWSPQKSNA